MLRFFVNTTGQWREAKQQNSGFCIFSRVADGDILPSGNFSYAA
jgi:hypothetical protein